MLYYNELTIHLPAFSLESKNADRVAGKTDGARDGSKNARKSDCLLSGGARRMLERVTFNNKLEEFMQKKMEVTYSSTPGRHCKSW